MKSSRIVTSLAALALTASSSLGAIIINGSQYGGGSGDQVATDLADSSQSTFLSISETGYVATDGGSPVSTLVDGAEASHVSENFAAQNGTFSVTINLDVSTNVSGYDLTQINTYAGNLGHWGTKLQTYDLYVSTVGSAVFTLLYQVDVNLGDFGGVVNMSGEYLELNITDSGGTLASGVDALRFDILPNNDPALLNAHYREFDVIGSPTVVPEPASAVLMSLGAAMLLRRRRA